MFADALAALMCALMLGLSGFVLWINLTADEKAKAESKEAYRAWVEGQEALRRG